MVTYYSYNSPAHHGERLIIQPGVPVLLEMPYSEVCMHMRVAGKAMWAAITENGYGVQLLDSDRLDEPFSFPITLGEAGIFRQ